MRRHRFCLMLLLALAAAPLAAAGQGLVSTKKNVSAYMEFNGYHIVPVGTMPVPGDQSDAQIFEINRPGMGPITVGRLYTSCTCIQATMQKRKFAHGETATITLRNVRPTSGQTYPFYVQITSPFRATLRYDTWVISDQFVVAPPVIEPEPVVVEEATPAEAVEVVEATPAEAVAAAEESEEPAKAEDAVDAADAAPETAEPAKDDGAAVEPIKETLEETPEPAAPAAVEALPEPEVVEAAPEPAVEEAAEPVAEAVEPEAVEAEADEPVADKYSTTE
ncbi:MAG: hypothetical protein LUE17_07040 [Planctomycetaceae bacterium]|nr:hypothetical protein [Planctomycetaceae bacterium]